MRLKASPALKGLTNIIRQHCLENGTRNVTVRESVTAQHSTAPRAATALTVTILVPIFRQRCIIR